MHLKILSTLVVFLLCMGLFAEENLIRNGNMELGEGNPANWGMWGWQRQNAIFKLETGAAHGGRRFATIINNENNDSRFIQEVLVETGSKYRISGWIRTENVGSGNGVKGASICILEDEKHTTNDITGTNGKWEYVEFYLTIGENVRKITISLAVGGLRKVNTGKASFDDVQMAGVSEIPKEARSSVYAIKNEVAPTTPPPPVTESEELTELPGQPWYSNPLFIVVLILVAVIIAAVVILLFSPKDKASPLPGELENIEDEKEDK